VESRPSRLEELYRPKHDSNHSIPFSVEIDVIRWSEFVATDPHAPDSIPVVIRFSDNWWVWNGFH
jgi:hypothetical protein